MQAFEEAENAFWHILWHVPFYEQIYRDVTLFLKQLIKISLHVYQE